MKKLTLLKSLLLATTLLFSIGISNINADTYSYSFSAKVWSAYGDQTLNGVTWTASATGGSYWGYDATKGQQFGSASSPANPLNLKTSGISGTITSIKVSTSGASSVVATFSVSVGGTAFTCSGSTSVSITATNTTYEFTGSGSGQIVLSWSQTSSKALYIKDIQVTYTSTSNPTLSATTLESFGEVAIGTTAGPKTFTLTGSNLTGNVTVGALNGFTYATTETGTYTSSLTLSPSGGSINQTIYVKFTPTAVQSYNGNITISSQGATSINVAVQGSGILAAPTATAATNVSANGFTANWNVVAGATGYQLQVYTKPGTTIILSEDFSKFTKGTPDGNADGTDISGSLDTYTLVPGWTGSRVYQAGGTTKVGTASVLGYLVTPALDLTGEITLSFKAMAWSGDATELKIYLDNVLVYTQTGLNNTDYTFNSYSITLTGGTATSKIKFEGKQATKGRFFLDDITITKAGQSTPISGSPFPISGGSTTSYTLSGLATNNTYYYTVKATDGSNTSASSNEISVELSSPSITVTPVDPLSFATNTGLTASKTITVSGLHLTSDIVLSVSDENVFSVSPTPLTPTNGTVSETEITITYHPTVSGTHTGTLTISSTGATTVEIALSGTATPLPVVDIVSLNEDGTFNMDWNTTGTLHVYEKVTDGSGNAEGLFFSKYFEADGNNKLLEIFNGTGSSVDLTGWKVQVFQNGTTPATIDWSSTKVSTYNLSGTLAHGEVYVMYTKDQNSTCSSSFNSSWNECTSPTLQFNGNDPIRLVNANGDVIDVFGQSGGLTPKNEWTATKSDGTILTTVRQLLVRDISVVSGANAVSSNTTSFATLGTEWNLYPMDYGEGQPIACNALI
ncbi:MAG TPA: lamin tail domain-containing protein, partial [Paludibacteraceae bacterium]|nr:lamin tail domain-containing protein [Paludibacteraceae bacterium]